MKITFMMQGFKMHEEDLKERQEEEQYQLDKKHAIENTGLQEQLQSIQADCPHEHILDTGFQDNHNNEWVYDLSCKLCDIRDLPKSYLR